LKALDFFRLLRETGWRDLISDLRDNIDFKVRRRGVTRARRRYGKREGRERERERERDKER